MKAVFVELPAFERWRADYLDDDAFGALQELLMQSPEAGDVVPGTGGLRKVRLADAHRHRGRRGGLRVIYFWWPEGAQFWLFTVYAKSEMTDLTSTQRKQLRLAIKTELDARQTQR